MTDATTSGLNPATTLQPLRYLPLPVRCAVEVFLASGDRTKPRLLDLIDHFLTVYGLAFCDERALYTDSAIDHVKRVAGLGTYEEF